VNTYGKEPPKLRRGFLSGETKHEILWKTVEIAFYLLPQSDGFDAIQRGHIAI